MPDYFYTADPTRNGTCFATHDPTVAPTPVPSVVVTDQGGGSGCKRKHRLLAEEPLPVRDYQQQIDRDTPQESLEVIRAKSEAAILAQAIIEQRREISRIKAQMRLSTNPEAMQAMEREIAAIEKHLLQIKRDAEDMLLLTILM